MSRIWNSYQSFSDIVSADTSMKFLWISFSVKALMLCQLHRNNKQNTSIYSISIGCVGSHRTGHTICGQNTWRNNTDLDAKYWWNVYKLQSEINVHPYKFFLLNIFYYDCYKNEIAWPHLSINNKSFDHCILVAMAVGKKSPQSFWPYNDSWNWHRKSLIQRPQENGFRDLKHLQGVGSEEKINFLFRKDWKYLKLKNFQIFYWVEMPFDIYFN